MLTISMSFVSLALSREACFDLQGPTMTSSGDFRS